MGVDQGHFSTGIPSLDRLFQGLLEGDNLVWQVSAVSDYEPFVQALAARALRDGRRVVYFRFATHPALLVPQPGLDVIGLRPAAGFEPFVSEIQNTIINGNRDCVYVFDCLSDLAADWCSDRMLGNFFMLTCPYVFDHGAGAYFALIRNRHSFHATDPVRQTTQILIDVHHYRDRIYIHPLKVQHRLTKTMFMLHVRDGEEFRPVTHSAEAAEVFSSVPWNRVDAANWRLGFWSQTFARADDLGARLAAGEAPAPETVALTQQLRRMLIAREGPVLALAEQHLELPELLAIWHRMIGTGLIGGKSVGLVLAQAILRRDPEWAARLEPSDSFFIGADVFYTYLVQNGLWWLKQRQKNPDAYLDGLTLARHQILNGQFPEYLMRQFRDLLDYFGQTPIIVRSSSLLEDDFDSSFAGKAESVVCANQGSLDQRLEDFLTAIRRVYASNMSEAALRYRAARGLLDKDEQMAILVQRISGVTYGHYLFPHVAGVGLSFNPFVWDSRIDPAAGVIRLVMGLGTRAVTPHPEDHTRLVALNAPQLELIDREDENAVTSQQEVDVLDLDAGRVVTLRFTELATAEPDLPLGQLAERDRQLERRAREHGLQDVCSWSLTFKQLLTEGVFVPPMRGLLQLLATAYGTAVDIEFTATLADADRFRINLLQCRPFLAEGSGPSVINVAELAESDCVVRSSGPVLGRSRSLDLDKVIYVSPPAYSRLSMQDRHAVARLIGALMQPERRQQQRILLIGPGRWGTSSPALGVPSAYAELKGAAALCEIADMHEGLTPDLSLGSHFFNELIETRMLYFAVYPKRDGNRLDDEFLTRAAAAADADPARLGGVVNVITCGNGLRLRLSADTSRQLAALHRLPESGTS